MEEYITCPICGTKVFVIKTNRLGRKPLNIGVKNVCDALQDCPNITQAARKLGCSRGYVHKALKSNGLSLRQVIEGEYNQRVAE